MTNVITTILVPDFICELDTCVHFSIIAIAAKLLHRCTNIIHIMLPGVDSNELSDNPVSIRIQCPIKIAKQIYQNM